MCLALALQLLVKAVLFNQYLWTRTANQNYSLCGTPPELGQSHTNPMPIPRNPMPIPPNPMPIPPDPMQIPHQSHANPTQSYANPTPAPPNPMPIPPNPVPIPSCFCVEALHETQLFRIRSQTQSRPIPSPIPLKNQEALRDSTTLASHPDFNYNTN